MGFQISRGSDFLRIILYNSINRKLSLKLKLKSVSGKSLRRINSIIKRRFLTRVFQKERRRSIITPPRNPSTRTSVSTAIGISPRFQLWMQATLSRLDRSSQPTFGPGLRFYRLRNRDEAQLPTFCARYRPVIKQPPIFRQPFPL